MLQPRVNEEVTYVSNCLGLSCIICAASLFRGSSGLGSCSHTALQLGMFGPQFPSHHRKSVGIASGCGLQQLALVGAGNPF